MVDCVFCKIAKGEIEAEIVFEGTNVVAFNDNSPSADTHILIIPKRHIASFMDASQSDREVLSQMVRTAQKLIKDQNLGIKYKLVINGGEYQFIPHLHLHLLGGEMIRKV